jgi:uncharacterized protein
MRQVTNENLARVVDAIVQEVDPEQIILFGSRARGESTADSDIDLLIVESEPFGVGRNRWQETARLWNLVAQFRMPIDILLYTHDEVEQWRDSRGHVIARAAREGRPLYERP